MDFCDAHKNKNNHFNVYMIKKEKKEINSERPPFFPMMLDLKGKEILIIGGGRVASRRAETLLKCGAKIKAISP